MKEFSTRIEKAEKAFNEGFSNNAQKKRCLDLIGNEYDNINRKLGDECLKSKDEESFWFIPQNLHQWKEKHSDHFRNIHPEYVSLIEELKDFRETVKSSEIAKVKNPNEEKRKAIETSIQKFLETRKSSYERGIKLGEHFGGLNVYANSHLVHRDGTTFVRCFYYLFGKLTALNTIIAVAEKLNEDKNNG